MKRKRFFNLSLIGAVVSGALASICCISPAVLALLGISGVGLFSKLGAFHPHFTGLSLLLLSLAFYLTYRRREMACENGTCEVKNAQRRNKIALWTATGLALLFITFPYIELPSMNVAKEERVRETKEVTLSVKGMTCSACEAEVESAVKKLGGIMQVKADYKKGEVYVKFEEGKTSVDDIVNAINKAGYRARE